MAEEKSEVAPELADQLDILERAIRDDGRTVAFLAGAGCAASVLGPDSRPLIPPLQDLTSDLAGTLAKEPGLTALLESLKSDGEDSTSVEAWLTRLRTLATIVGKDRVRGLDAAQIEGLEKAITREIAARLDVDLPPVGGGYDSLAHWSSSGSRSHPLEIFTLNYDLLFEQALERAGVPTFDGFVGSRQPFLDQRAIDDDQVPSRWVRLWKMHGSINWDSSGTQVVRVADRSLFSGTMIYPSHLKYDQSRRMPFLAMQDRLRDFLKQPGATLICVGYSFGDEHVNSLIFEGLRGNHSAVVFGMLYGKLDDYPLAAQGTADLVNLRLIARDQGVFAGRRQKWSTVDNPARPGDFKFVGEILATQAGALS